MSDAGVYMLTSKKNGAAYIGESTNLSLRLESHVRSILAGNHPNPRIRDSFAEHIRQDFEVRVIERVEVPENDPQDRDTWQPHVDGLMLLRGKERNWIIALRPSLNVQKTKPVFDIGEVLEGPPTVA
jgi:hypothetical protein